MNDSIAAPTVEESPARIAQLWQGVPGVAESTDGSLWVTWYAGGPKEPDADNHVILERSQDGGVSWTRTSVVTVAGSVRAFDPMLWVDPLGRLWHFWNQTDETSAELFDGRGGVWARHASIAEDGEAQWSLARRLCNGVAMNKPIVTAAGDWMLPASVWAQGPLDRTAEPREANVQVSRDDGETWTYRGGAAVHSSDRTFDEHMVVQLASGELWMLIRTLGGLAESFSQDGGSSWTLVRPSGFNPHNSSRVFFATLANGDHVLIRNSDGRKRDGLSLWRSRDDGGSWQLSAVIDDRVNLTYPDAVELADGRLAVIYDRDRAERGEIVLRFLTLGEPGQGAQVSAPIVVSEK